MKPEKLTLEGVYSYKKKTVIDFTTLCGAELFGIFGNVGSGKSAVLEAVTYVLYGKIERLPLKMMNYNMMNLSSDRMFIEFEFSNKESRYRFDFEAKRNRKDFEKIESPKRNAYLLDGGEWKPLFDRGSDVSAEEIIGLNYDNFRRTIIVPQGRFQEFLHLEKSKRTEMLMELFRLNRFDLYSKAASLSGANSEKIAVLEERIENLSEATKEAVEAAEKEFEELTAAAAEISTLIEESDAALNEMNELSRLGKAVGEAETRLTAVQAAEPDYEQRKKRLAVFEECREKIKPLLDRYDGLTRDYGMKTMQLSEAGAVLKTAAAAAEAAERAFTALSEKYKGIDLLKAQKGWYTDLSRLENERLSVAETKSALETAEAEVSKLRRELEKVTAGISAAAAELGSAGRSDKTAEQMAVISFAFRSIADRKKEAASADETLKELRKRLEGLSGKQATLGNPDEDEKILEQRREALAGKMLEREVLRSVGKLATGLEPGIPCPVCGSTAHPAPADLSTDADAGLEAEEAELQRELQLIKSRRDALATLRQEAVTVEADIRNTAENSLKIEKEISKTAGRIEEGGYSVSDFESFDREYREFLSNSEKREVLLEKQNELSGEKERLSAAVNAVTEKAGRLRVELGRSEAVIKEIEGRIDPDFLKGHEDFSGKQLSQKAEALEGEISGLEEGFRTAEKTRTDTSLARERAASEAELLGKQAAELENERTELGEELTEAVFASGFKSEQKVREILSEIRSAADERRELEQYEKERARAEKELAVLREQLAGRTYDEEIHRAELEKNGQLKEKYRGSVNRQGEIGNILSELRHRLERRLESEKELRQLKVRGENLRTLKNLFRGNEFANYVARVYLGELCESANARFRKLTRESLRLELDESNNFIIRDYLNEGKTRSVKTLSGGQTFQAAFSLSLALADSIGRERSGFFFLDEGFGSLDRESLSLVFDTLKSLKKEKRTVGIISHVEELKQEIDTYITVSKDDDEGSLIKKSWE